MLQIKDDKCLPLKHLLLVSSRCIIDWVPPIYQFLLCCQQHLIKYFLLQDCSYTNHLTAMVKSSLMTGSQDKEKAENSK